MPQFLNRLLALPIAEQNQLFAALEARIESNIEQAMESGSFEVGVETVRADSLSVAGRETLYEHPGAGAATDLVEIVRHDRLDPTTAESGCASSAPPRARPWRGPSSKRRTGVPPTRPLGAPAGNTRSPSCHRTGSHASGSPPACCSPSGTGCRSRTCG